MNKPCFKKGDIVRCVSVGANTNLLTEGGVYVVECVDERRPGNMVTLEDIPSRFFAHRFVIDEIEIAKRIIASYDGDGEV